MSKNIPLISIIVPVYNVERYLRTCVKSLLGQTYKNIEIILVNDGSRDESGTICDELKKNNDKISVIHKENGGLASARNKGLEYAKGKYVTFVDSDDYVAEDMYECLYEAIIRTSSKIACCNWLRHIDTEGKKEIISPIGQLYTDETILSKEQAIKSLLLNNGMTYSACDKLFKKELFDEIRFPCENLPSEDIPCIYKIIKNADRIVHIGEAKYYYRIVQGSISTQTFTKRNISTFEYMTDVVEDVVKCYPNLRKESEFALIQCADSLYNRLVLDKKHKEYREISEELKQQIRKSLGKIIFNPFFTFNAKIVNIFITFNMYPLFLLIVKRGSNEK